MRSLTVSLLLVVVVAVFALGITLDALFDRYVNKAEQSRPVVVSVAEGLAVTLNGMEQPTVFVQSWSPVDNVTLTLTSLADYPLPQPLNEKLLAGEALLLESNRGMSVNYYLPAHDLVFSMDDIPGASDDRRLTRVIFTSLFYLGTLLLVFLWLKPLLIRLHKLKNAAEEFGAGDLDSRVQAGGFSYIADIESQYNQMAERIQTLVEDNKLLTSAVSHDLRTPLARLRFGIDTLATTNDPTVRNKYEKRVSADLDEMESLVDSLLRFARLDNVMDDVEKSEIALKDLIEECMSQYLDEPVHLILQGPDPSSQKPVVYGSYTHLATMINNLLQNAVAYGVSEVLIEISARSAGFSVHDDGPGIPEAQRGTMLKPFQRGDESKRGGYGLGLAVVARIAAHHNAQLVVGQSSELGGAKFTVTFESADF